MREGLVVGGDRPTADRARGHALREAGGAGQASATRPCPRPSPGSSSRPAASLATLNEVAPQVTHLQGDHGRCFSAHVEASTGPIAEIDRQIAASTDHARALDGAIGEADASPGAWQKDR